MDRDLLENQKNSLNFSLYNLKRRELQEVLSEVNVLLGFARSSLKEMDSLVKDIDKANRKLFTPK